MKNNSKIGFARPNNLHQTLITNLLLNLNDECLQNGYVCLPEATVTQNINDSYPDVTVFDSQDLPIVVFELTNNRGVWYDKRKCVSLMNRFEGLDCFILNYENEILYYWDYELQDWITSDKYEIHSLYFKYAIEYYFQNIRLGMDRHDVLCDIHTILSELKRRWNM